MRVSLIFLISLLFFGCAEKQVTFVVEIPDGTPIDKSIYISGDFESWSGGADKYKLKKSRNTYVISLPLKTNIQYKFTLGSWDQVETDVRGSNIENRVYNYTSNQDTVFVKVASWASMTQRYGPSTASKNVRVLQDSMFMPQLNRYRRIWAYVPPNYENTDKAYPVLYMHDGQNVFDKATAYAGEWEVDETLNKLYIETGFELIVVAIDNGRDMRMSEYSPWVNKHVEQPEGNAYVDFLVKTLKPYIDKTLRTKTDSESTAILGSSMGGLISHYAGMKYPEVFGKVGVFSSSFWISDKAYAEAKRTSGNLTNKMYFLVGGNEGDTMDSDTKNMAKTMINNGFNSKNIQVKVVEKGTHSEGFWRSEFKEAISWLFEDEVAKSNPLKIEAEPVSEATLYKGTLHRIENFYSKYITSRPVDIWLPENYSETKTYAVLYMHDGQMLFDATSTWNKQEWQVDEVASQLMEENKVRDFIVVAPHNIPEIRHSDFFPKKPFESLPSKTQDSLLVEAKNSNMSFAELNSDNYLKFLVKELKPYVDSHFSTLSNAENTFVMGSSMGGLISMYALCEYPEIFSGAACLSTHWIGTFTNKNNPIPNAFLKYMQENLPDPNSHTLYFDYGTETLDAMYLPYQMKVLSVLKSKGYSLNKEFEGHDHSEASWQKRINIPLTLLLKKE